MLTREQLLAGAAAAKPIGTINVPELSGDIGIRALSAQDFMDFRTQAQAREDETDKADDGIERTAELVTKLLANEDGSRMFGDKDAEILFGFGYVFLERIVEEGFALNGIGKEAAEATEKN